MTTRSDPQEMPKGEMKPQVNERTLDKTAGEIKISVKVTMGNYKSWHYCNNGL